MPTLILQVLIIHRIHVKLLISVGFTLIVMYQYYMYFLIYPDLNIENLYLPNFLKGIGHGVLYISLTIYVAKHIPFKHFFQSLCVLSFIRTGIATSLGAAILNRRMKHLQRANRGLLSRNMDNLHEWMPDVSVIQLYNEVNTQTMLINLKELFGWVRSVRNCFSCNRAQLPNLARLPLGSYQNAAQPAR